MLLSKFGVIFITAYVETPLCHSSVKFFLKWYILLITLLLNTTFLLIREKQNIDIDW